MRRMWLWVLLYAILVGFILFFAGFFVGLYLGMSPPRGIAYDIGQIASMGSISAVFTGFVVFIAGFVLLLRRGKFSVGRLVSLIGIWVYYIAALGVVLAVAMSEDPPWAIVVFTLAIAVLVGLPGFFITRTLRRAPKSGEY